MYIEQMAQFQHIRLTVKCTSGLHLGGGKGAAASLDKIPPPLAKLTPLKLQKYK